MIVLSITIVLLVVFYLLNFLLGFFSYDSEKLRAFECGFSSIGKVQNSFRIHFFVIIIMFVVFDLEIVILLGVLVSDFGSFMSFIWVFVFILGGFYIEWWFGKLVWAF